MKTSGEGEAGIGQGMMGKGKGESDEFGEFRILDSQQEIPRSGSILDAEEVWERLGWIFLLIFLDFALQTPPN